MASAKDHYQRHLAAFYGWMTGSFEGAEEKQMEYFVGQDIRPYGNGIAIDLGAGHGLQSIPLAKIGFKVKAIDFSNILLEELEQRKSDLAIETICADIEDFDQHLGSAELIICMGDTLPHLQSFARIEALVQKIYRQLEPGGKMVLSFRDYGQELTGTHRFIPVRADDNRILTCVLEYDKDYVMVTDLLYERSEQGWQQKVSSYRKVRMSLQGIEASVTAAGLTVIDKQWITGMHYLVATKLGHTGQ